VGSFRCNVKGLLKIMFHNGKVGYIELLFIMISVGNLYINLGGYFELTFIMVEVSNLNVK
jgi:hypothetical protein